MALPPQATPVEIHYTIDETSRLSEISDKMNEYQLQWYKYSKKIKPVIYTNESNITFKLHQLSTLLENWDGYDAIPPYQQSIDNCRKFINRLPLNVVNSINVEHIHASNYGTIIFELFNQNNEKVSIEFGRTKLGFFSSFNDKNEFQIDEVLFNYNFLPPELISAITKLYKSYIF